MGDVEIRVGASLRETAAEAAAAWTAAEAGDYAAPVERISFVDWSALCAVLTPMRYELVRQLRREPAAGVRALARILGRDVKNVHADVAALTRLGLVVRGEDERLTAPYDEIVSTIRFAA